MTAALEGGEWSAARPGRTLPPGKTRYPLYRRLGGPQGQSGRAERLVPTGIRSRTVQPVVSIPTELPGPWIYRVHLFILLKYLCNLARYWLQAVCGWHDSVETCSSVITCGEIIVYLLVIVQNNKLYYQQLHLKYLCNLANYWFQTVWGWHDSAETCSSAIICETIVHLLEIVQNSKIISVQCRQKLLDVMGNINRACFCILSKMCTMYTCCTRST